jgi:hypothetical protein
MFERVRRFVRDFHETYDRLKKIYGLSLGDKLYDAAIRTDFPDCCSEACKQILVTERRGKRNAVCVVSTETYPGPTILRADAEGRWLRTDVCKTFSGKPKPCSCEQCENGVA